jgi:hypothetical protein
MNCVWASKRIYCRSHAIGLLPRAHTSGTALDKSLFGRQGYGDRRTLERRVASMEEWMAKPNLMAADPGASYREVPPPLRPPAGWRSRRPPIALVLHTAHLRAPQPLRLPHPQRARTAASTSTTQIVHLPRSRCTPTTLKSHTYHAHSARVSPSPLPPQVIEINMSEIKEPILCAPNDPDDARLLSEVQGDSIHEVPPPPPSLLSSHPAPPCWRVLFGRPGQLHPRGARLHQYRLTGVQCRTG